MALLFPIDWPEPFGLVMIEAMANGTPVVAFRRGAVPEILDHGVTGIVVDDVKGGDWRACRKRLRSTGKGSSVGSKSGSRSSVWRAITSRSIARCPIAGPQTLSPWPERPINPRGTRPD